MNVTSHLIVGSSAYIGLMTLQPQYDLLITQNYSYYVPIFPVLGLGVCLIGALLPDVDHPSSTVGKLVPFLSYPISAIFGHRGITHSLLMISFMIWYLYEGVQHTTFTTSYIKYFTVPLVVGYLSHLIADMMTPAGLPLLYPLKRRFNIAFIQNKGIQYLVSLALLGLTTWLYTKFGYIVI